MQHKEDFLTGYTVEKFIGIFLGQRLGRFYFSMWFILVLFVAELLLFFVCKWTKNKTKYLAVGVFLTSLAGWGLLKVWKQGFFWSLDLVPVNLSFLILGYLLKLEKDRLETYCKKWLLPVAFGANLGFAYINYRLYGMMDLYYGNTGNYVLFMLAAISGIWGILILSRWINRNVVLEYIGKNTLVFYAFQNSLFLPGATKIILTLGSRWPIFGNSIVKFVCVMVVACIGLSIWSQMINQTFPFLLGKKSERKKNDVTKL